MSEDVYALPDLTKKVRHGRGEKKVELEEKGEQEDRGEWEERTVDIYDTGDSLKAHDPDPGTQQHVVEKNTAREKRRDSDETKKNHFMEASVCLGVLCVLLLGATIGVVVHYFEQIKEKNNLAKELNEIKTTFNHLTEEKAMLQTSFDNLAEEKATLQTNFNNLTEEKATLQTSFNNLTEEKATLQTRFDQLQTSYQNLTEERDDLKRRFCDSHGFTFDGNTTCYYISAVMKNWEDSSDHCISKHSNLTIIKSKEKQDFLVSLNQRLWLGLTDIDKEDKWKWIDETPLTTPTFWNHNEPNNGGKWGEDCAEVNGEGWNDMPCRDEQHYVCEIVI